MKRPNYLFQYVLNYSQRIILSVLTLINTRNGGHNKLQAAETSISFGFEIKSLKSNVNNTICS